MGLMCLNGHFNNDQVNFLYLIVLGLSAMIGGFLGAKFTNRFSQLTLKRLIGVGLAIVEYLYLPQY